MAETTIAEDFHNLRHAIEQLQRRLMHESTDTPGFIAKQVKVLDIALRDVEAARGG